jgi:hypothetical protein
MANESNKIEFFQKSNFNPDFVYNGIQICKVSMRFEVVQNLNDEAFRRLTGLKWETFKEWGRGAPLFRVFDRMGTTSST